MGGGNPGKVDKKRTGETERQSPRAQIGSYVHDIPIHGPKVTQAACQHEQMKNLMKPQAGSDVGPLQRINDGADTVQDAAGHDPSHSGRGH